MADSPLLVRTDRGLFCPAGDFYVDPWEEVDRAVLTHGHGDHARRGSKRYLATRESRGILATRLGPEARVQEVEYGERVDVNGVTVSLHPAGHILGSAQVRVEHGGEVWVVSGDYKVGPDATCVPFEPVKCHTFVSEATFALPVFVWPSQEEVFEGIRTWWKGNQAEGRTSVLLGYALGKAQRLIAGVGDAQGPVWVHGAVANLNRAYEAAGVSLPRWEYADTARAAKEFNGRGLLVAPPSVLGTPWLRKFGAASTAFASGWMRLRGAKRRKGVDQGFVLSDHADWPGLLEAISATGAGKVILTHGSTAGLARWLDEKGYETQIEATPYEGEEGTSSGADEGA